VILENVKPAITDSMKWRLLIGADMTPEELNLRADEDGKLTLLDDLPKIARR